MVMTAFLSLFADMNSEERREERRGDETRQHNIKLYNIRQPETTKVLLEIF